MRKILIILCFVSLPGLFFGGTLHVDDFADSSSPNLLGGPYGVYGYNGGTASLDYQKDESLWGTSMVFSYDVGAQTGAGAQVWMCFYSDRSVDFREYSHLRFFARGSTGNEVFRVMVRDTAGHYRSVDVKNYLPGGQLTAVFQKVLIPLTAFRYQDCDPSRMTNLFFYAEKGMGADSGSIHIQDIILSTGADRIYADNMEVDESPYDNSALMFDVYSGSGNSGGSAYSFGTNFITNESCLGSGAYCLKHITKATNTQWAYAQTVWLFGYLNQTPPLDLTACDELRFFAKKGARDTGGRRYLILGYESGGAVLGAGHYEITGLTASWNEYTVPLSVFAGADLSRVLELRLVTEWNSGVVTNITLIDEIMFCVNHYPQSPTNIRVNGKKIGTGFLFPKGRNVITSTLFSNKTVDRSVGHVISFYGTNGAYFYRKAGIEYRVENSDITNIWDTSLLDWTNSFVFSHAAFNSKGGRGQGFSYCRINQAENSFRVCLSNVEAAGLIAFGRVTNENIPKIAQNAGGAMSYAQLDYDLVNVASGWKIICYTDNTNILAFPRFRGAGNMLYGNVNDGTGLVGAGGGANASNSTPLKIWCDARDTGGFFIRSPCEKWKGTAPGLFGVPAPFHQGGETGLYWNNQDLNNNGINDEALLTNAHWTEASKNYDANGDGDFNDSSTGITGDALGKVFEYSSWMCVTADSRSVPGANTAELASSVLNNPVPGRMRVYFAVTDDLAGDFKTNRLVFELVIY